MTRWLQEAPACAQPELHCSRPCPGPWDGGCGSEKKLCVKDTVLRHPSVWDKEWCLAAGGWCLFPACCPSVCVAHSHQMRLLWFVSGEVNKRYLSGISVRRASGLGLGGCMLVAGVGT